MGKKLYPLQKASGKKMYHPGRIYTPANIISVDGNEQYYVHPIVLTPKVY